MRIMLDTNIIASAILFPSQRMNALMEDITEHHEMCIASYVLNELNEVVARKFPNKKEALDRFLLKARFTIVRTPEFIEKGLFEIRDKKDYPVLYTAIVEDMDLLITGDKDFAEVEVTHPKILTPAEYLERYL
jgi:putative PIN family toxin of toxin-antitoxin system